jgi:hypothetical protein
VSAPPQPSGLRAAIAPYSAPVAPWRVACLALEGMMPANCSVRKRLRVANDAQSAWSLKSLGGKGSRLRPCAGLARGPLYRRLGIRGWAHVLPVRPRARVGQRVYFSNTIEPPSGSRTRLRALPDAPPSDGLGFRQLS